MMCSAGSMNDPGSEKDGGQRDHAENNVARQRIARAQQKLQ